MKQEDMKFYAVRPFVIDGRVFNEGEVVPAVLMNDEIAKKNSRREDAEMTVTPLVDPKGITKAALMGEEDDDDDGNVDGETDSTDDVLPTPDMTSDDDEEVVDIKIDETGEIKDVQVVEVKTPAAPKRRFGKNKK
jgi:hypothetical protein